MSIRTKITVSNQINQAQTAINNSLADAEIQKLIAVYGYKPAKLLEGRKAVQAAAAAVEAQISASGAQLASTAKARKTESEARDAYQALATVARAVYLRDRPQRVALGLGAQMPRPAAAFLTAAYTLFDNILCNPEVKATLAGYGYDDARLQAERNRIGGYDAVNQAQEAAKGAAQQATQEQGAAMTALGAWYGQFLKIAKMALKGKPQLLEKLGITARSSKTPAQRAAPQKAAATRKARNGLKEVAQPKAA